MECVCLFAAVLAALMMLVTATGASAATPTLGSSPDWSTVDGAVPYGSGHAIPLKAATPAWFTDELAARVHEANGAPVAAPVGVDDQVPSYIAGTRMGRILQIAGQPLANSPLC